MGIKLEDGPCSHMTFLAECARDTKLAGKQWVVLQTVGVWQPSYSITREISRTKEIRGFWLVVAVQRLSLVKFKRVTLYLGKTCRWERESSMRIHWSWGISIFTCCTRPGVSLGKNLKWSLWVFRRHQLAFNMSTLTLRAAGTIYNSYWTRLVSIIGWDSHFGC